MKLDEIPVTIWALLGGQFVAFAIAWGRALLTISNQKEDIKDIKSDLKEAINELKIENREQNKTTKDMYDKVSATQVSVATIVGMLKNCPGAAKCGD